MGVYIRGMTKAKNCSECHFFHIESFQKWCCITEREDIFLDAIPDWCPLVEVKTPHGDLIDREVIKQDLSDFYNGIVTARRLIDAQDAVIEAEGMEE